MCDTRWLTLYPLIREAGERAFEIHRALAEMGEHEWQAFRQQLAARGDAYALSLFDWIADGERERRGAVRLPSYGEWYAGTREESG